MPANAASSLISTYILFFLSPPFLDFLSLLTYFEKSLFRVQQALDSGLLLPFSGQQSTSKNP
jgi:hypothetical protein